MIDSNKIHCLGEGQPTEEARVLLGESHASIEHVPMPTLDDSIQHESEMYNVDNACRGLNR